MIFTYYTSDKQTPVSEWSKPYREIRCSGQEFQVRKRLCTCDCHLPESAIMHFIYCCEDGWIYQRKLIVPLGTVKPVLKVVIPKSYVDFVKNNPSSLEAFKQIKTDELS